jgi:hypothetical protein
VLRQGDDQEKYLILAQNALMYNEGEFSPFIVMHAFATSGIGYSVYDISIVMSVIALVIGRLPVLAG